NTQLIIAEESGIPNVVDPLGGSYYVERLTHSIATEAMKLIAEVEALGGMTKAVEQGLPKLRIEESAALRQARIDRGEETIVGVNKYRPENPEHVDILAIDNTAVREAQVARIHRIRSARDEAKCQAALATLSQAAAAAAGAASGEGNLLALSIEAGP